MVLGLLVSMVVKTELFLLSVLKGYTSTKILFRLLNQVRVNKINYSLKRVI